MQTNKFQNKNICFNILLFVIYFKKIDDNNYVKKLYWFLDNTVLKINVFIYFSYSAYFEWHFFLTFVRLKIQIHQDFRQQAFSVRLH